MSAMNIRSLLESAEQFVDPYTGIISQLIREDTFPDEPRIIGYSAEVCDFGIFSDGWRLDQYQGAASLNEDLAQLKAIMEGIERYCLGVFRTTHFIYGSYAEMSSKAEALDPQLFKVLAEDQANSPTFEQFRVNWETPFAWVKGYSLTKERNIWVPAMLVYLPFPHELNTPLIMYSTSNGAAAGASFESAIFRGLCELIERDAFLITYLNQLERVQISLPSISNREVAYLYRQFERCELKWHAFEITSDIPIPVILSIAVDLVGTGPAISVGMKAHPDIEEAILGSALECLHGRSWIRSHLNEHLDRLPYLNEHMFDIDDVLDRGLLWSQSQMIHNLDFLLSQPPASIVSRQFQNNLGLDDLKRNFDSRNWEIVVVDVTTQDVRQAGFSVVKVIVPQLIPFYLFEKTPYWGNDRIYTVPVTLGYRSQKTTFDSLLKIPHPFL